jgi:serine/threonine-protein kinase HipA
MESLTIQVFAHGLWIDAATITTSDSSKGWQNPIDMAYNRDHIALYFGQQDQVALSSHYPVDFLLQDEKQWPTFLLDILPQGYGKRRILQDWPNETNTSDDWYLLSIGASNPVGNIRIKEAHESMHSYLADVTKKYQNGFSLQEVTNSDPAFLEYLVSCHYGIAGSSGLQGECPKYLLTEDKQGRFFIDGTIKDEQVKRCFILKQPKTINNRRDSLILSQEANYLEFARKLGLKVFEPIQRFDGCTLIPRFDRRTQNGHLERIAQESLLTLMNKAGYGVRFYHQEAIIAMQKICTSPHLDIAEYVLRDMANIALGNRDNHGRNTAFHRFDGHIAISPLFDFAPMYLDQDAITRSATWQHFEKFGSVNYADVIDWLFDEIDCVKNNKKDFVAAMRSVLTNFADVENTANECGIHPDIIRQCKESMEAIKQSAEVMTQKLVAKLAPSGGPQYG